MDFLQITKKQDYAIVQLKRGKVNALNHQMVEEIRETIRSLEKDDSVRGVIITGTPHFFTAGLDVIELYGYDKAKMKDFFISFGSMHVELAQFTKPLIAAITGHSPAGGCVIAICCDYRIMAEGDKYTIGLNEIAVNIQISHNIINAYSFWIGTQKANQYILDGKLLSVQEALACGLVDEVCSLDQVLDQAEAKMQQYLRADQNIFVNTKAKLRHNWLKQINEHAESDLEEVFNIWWTPEVRVRMKAFVDWLTTKK